MMEKCRTCQHFICQRDSNDEIAITHCTHPDNLDPDHEGNTTQTLCPLREPLQAPSGARFNAGKAQLSLILEAQQGLTEAARVLEFGAKKYARGNWHKGLSHTRICDSLLRHLTSYLSGEDVDPESGCKHVGHILVNALFLAEMVNTRPDLDDRSEELLK